MAHCAPAPLMSRLPWPTRISLKFQAVPNILWICPSTTIQWSKVVSCDRNKVSSSTASSWILRVIFGRIHGSSTPTLVPAQREHFPAIFGPWFVGPQLPNFLTHLKSCYLTYTDRIKLRELGPSELLWHLASIEDLAVLSCSCRATICGCCAPITSHLRSPSCPVNETKCLAHI